MRRLFITCLTLFLAFAAAQDHSEFSYRQHIEEPMTITDFGLDGPVRSIRVDSFAATFDSDLQPTPSILRGGGGSGDIYALHIVFSPEGRPIEASQFGASGNILRTWTYFYSDGEYRGYEATAQDGTSIFRYERIVSNERLLRTSFRDFRNEGWDEFYSYDENGNLIAFERFRTSSTTPETTSYRYQGDRLIEKVDGDGTTRYRYETDLLMPDRVLLVEEQWTGDPVRHRRAARIPQGRTLYYYLADGTLSEIWWLSNWPMPDDSYAERVDFIYRYDPEGNLIQEISYGAPFVGGYTYEREFNEAGDLVTWTQIDADSGGIYRQCTYLDFDAYRNWTRLQCERLVPVDQLPELLKPFSGTIVTRSITYY